MSELHQLSGPVDSGFRGVEEIHEKKEMRE